MEDITSETTEIDAKKPVKDIPVVQDEGLFQHDTGDTYDGFFEAKKKDRSLKMHGPGVYMTAEGDIYTGTWDNDRLGGNEEVTIAFSDTSKYKGFFKDWCYSGRGKYFYPDNCILQCDFVENCPSGNLILLDPNGHTWLGKAEHGYGWFEPVNHFYNILENTRESGRSKRRQSKKKQSVTPVKSAVSAKSASAMKSAAATKSSVAMKSSLPKSK